MKNIVYYILLLVLAVSCATPSTPQGGPQDKTAPTVKTYNPENLTKNFSQKDIIITFDEWVQVMNLNQQLIISPPILPEPNITARKNQLLIHFKGSPDTNTTYSIFFGESVKDNNEANVISNLSYVFSTGDHIDSMYISGKVITLDGSPVPANTFVQLYSLREDSVITKERPKYIYKVATDGIFKLNYLPGDTFKLFVLNDLNSNYMYDLPTEWVGKYDSMLIMTQPVENITLPVVLPESSNFKIAAFNNTLANNIVTIELNKELNPQKDTIFLKNLSPGNILPLKPESTNKFFNFFVTTDSLSISCELSINGKVLDTLKLRKPSVPSENELFRPKVQMTQKDSILSALDNATFEFISNVPVEKINKEKIFLISENDTSQIDSVSIHDDTWSFSVHQPLKESLNGKLLFSDSAVVYRTGKVADTIKYQIKHSIPAEYGQMTFQISFPSVDTTYHLRVLNKNGSIFFETAIQGDTSYKYVFPLLKSGEFYVEVIEDLNRSATWNGASFWDSRPPEKVFKSESFSVKPNWEDTYEIKVRLDKQQIPTKPVNILELIKNPVSTNPQTETKSNPNANTGPAPAQLGRPNLQMR